MTVSNSQEYSLSQLVFPLRSPTHLFCGFGCCWGSVLFCLLSPILFPQGIMVLPCTSKDFLGLSQIQCAAVFWHNHSKGRISLPSAALITTSSLALISSAATSHCYHWRLSFLKTANHHILVVIWQSFYQVLGIPSFHLKPPCCVKMILVLYCIRNHSSNRQTSQVTPCVESTKMSGGFRVCLRFSENTQ